MPDAVGTEDYMRTHSSRLEASSRKVSSCCERFSKGSTMSIDPRGRGTRARTLELAELREEVGSSMPRMPLVEAGKNA